MTTRASASCGRRATTLGDRAFVAGAFVGDAPGAAWDADAYRRQIETIQRYGGIPVIFQSYGLVSQPPAAIIDAYAATGQLLPAVHRL